MVYDWYVVFLKTSPNSGTDTFFILLKIYLGIEGLEDFNLFVILRVSARERKKKLLV